jgi:acetylornithine aminotransferase/acetylornithine/N-succinyldiaminopimelate aminotransferase
MNPNNDARVPSYRRLPLRFTHGQGTRLFDDRGKSYLDFLSGLGVSALGHAHPGLTEVLRDQAGKLLHVSNLYDEPLQKRCAAKLAKACDLDLVFFSNSGAEANECALKMARRYQFNRGERKRSRFLALNRSFHGRTMGALSVTAKEAYRNPFAPLIPDVQFVPPENARALEEALKTETFAALILEPIQGESGVYPLSKSYLQTALELSHGTGTLLVMDEIQTGGGRTGSFLACQQLELTPDIVTLAKPLAGGIPIGATLALQEVGKSLQPGDHGSTFGGNPLACRAALFFLEELLERGLLERVQRVGERFRQGLQQLADKHRTIQSIRGQGLMLAIDLDKPSGEVNERLLERGLLANSLAETALRFLPPFIVQDAEIDQALDILDQSL